MDSGQSCLSSNNLPIIEDSDSNYTDDDSDQINSIPTPKFKYRTRQYSKKKNKHKTPSGKNAPTYKFLFKEVEEAVNLLNDKDTFFDNPYKFEKLYCIQNIYKYDNRSKSMASFSRLAEEALICLENRDWVNYVLVILRALQCSNIPRTVLRNFILMEILYDPAIKNSEIAQQCLSLMCPNVSKPTALLKNLTLIPTSSGEQEQLSSNDEFADDDGDMDN